MALEGGELAALIGTVMTTGGAAILALGRWLGRHFDTIAAQHQAEKSTQRADFLRTLEGRDKAFLGTLERIETECHRDREIDREQRAEDRALLLRAIGLATKGDTGAFKTEPKKKRRRDGGSGSSEDVREEEGGVTA